MIITRWPSRRSFASKPRPLTIGIRIVWKKSGVMMRSRLGIRFLRSNALAVVEQQAVGAAAGAHRRIRGDRRVRDAGDRARLPSPSARRCRRCAPDRRRTPAAARSGRSGRRADRTRGSRAAARWRCGSAVRRRRAAAARAPLRRRSARRAGDRGSRRRSSRGRRRAGRSARRCAPARSAGARPQTTLLTSASATAKPSAIGSMRACSSRGTPCGLHATTAAMNQRASSSPAPAGAEREHDALGQQLPDDAPLAGAERRADRNLARPRRAAREQQVGHVAARDEQHDARPPRAARTAASRSRRRSDP